MSTLTVNDLRFEVRRSAQRRVLEITVDRGGELIISAPQDAPDADLRALLAAIEAGEVYQVNHSARRHGRLHAGSTRALFEALRRAQPEGYLMWLDTGDHQVLSLSPELFFDWDGDAILLRPMKGTAPRDADPAQDGANAKALARCPKERAENVMTVDLMRNDVSRIARPHSVQVPRLFDVQGLPTVWQMTSDITARTRADTALVDVMAALFPCASVTGAPKARAMHHIRLREPDARGVYCGAVGVLRPGAGAVFNVAIRTVVARGDALTCGVGSGITAGSSAAGEWREWRHKRGFVERASEPFALLETLALVDGDGGVAATYAGYNNNTYAGPTLNIEVSAVPEADSWLMVLAGLSVISLSLRRNVRCSDCARFAKSTGEHDAHEVPRAGGRRLCRLGAEPCSR